MADSSSNDNADLFGGITPAPNSKDPSSPWNYNWLDPYGNFVASLPDQMPGPLSLERINGPREFYTDPQAYFAARPASDAGPSENDVSPNWARPMVDINSDSGGGVGVSDTSAAMPQQQAAPSSDWDGTVGTASGPTIVDDPNQAASMGTNFRVSLHPDLAGQIEQYAKDRGISVGQYAIDQDGNIGFYDRSGNFVLERPSVGMEFGKFWNDPSGTNAADAFSAIGNLGAAHGRELADQALATTAGAIAGGPLDPASIPIAIGAAAAMDHALQRLGNGILRGDLNDSHVDIANAIGQGLISGAGQAVGLGVGHFIPKLAEISPYASRAIIWGANQGTRTTLHTMVHDSATNREEPTFYDPSLFYGP